MSGKSLYRETFDPTAMYTSASLNVQNELSKSQILLAKLGFGMLSVTQETYV